MSNFKNNLSPEEKRKRSEEKLNAIRQYHADLIKDLGIDSRNFQMKYPYEYGKENCYVQLYDSEFKRENGFYFELINGALEPIDPARKVYRVSYNLNYEKEYTRVEKEINGELRILYNVPLDETRKVDPYSAAISKSASVTTGEKEKVSKYFNSVSTFSVSLEDAPYSEMTIRDYMAIHTGNPVSLKGWLNDLIKTTK